MTNEEFQELVVRELKELKMGQQNLESGQQALESGMHELKSEQQELKLGQQQTNERLSVLAVGQKRLEENQIRLEGSQIRSEEKIDKLAELQADDTYSLVKFIHGKVDKIDTKLSLLNDRLLVQEADIRGLKRAQ